MWDVQIREFNSLDQQACTVILCACFCKYVCLLFSGCSSVPLWTDCILVNFIICEFVSFIPLQFNFNLNLKSLSHIRLISSSCVARSNGARGENASPLALNFSIFTIFFLVNRTLVVTCFSFSTSLKRPVWRPQARLPGRLAPRYATDFQLYNYRGC